MKLFFLRRKLSKIKKNMQIEKKKKKWGVVWDSSLEFIIIQEGFQPHFLKTPL